MPGRSIREANTPVTVAPILGRRAARAGVASVSGEAKVLRSETTRAWVPEIS